MTLQFIGTIQALALAISLLGWVVGILPFYVPIIVCAGIGISGIYLLHKLVKETPDFRDLDD